ncbi:hypothetical protein DPJ14_24790, partial [Salmonella enterica subsp. enterica serovar Enteritidis]|nr:hypothetical protein [Salmonella enterica subsp. enterica serovar Enteritidis]
DGAYRLLDAPCQAEGLMASVFRLIDISLAVPDHTTVSRRAAVLPPLPHIQSEGDLHILIDKHRAESLRRRSVAGGETWGAGPARLA